MSFGLSTSGVTTTALREINTAIAASQKRLTTGTKLYSSSVDPSAWRTVSNLRSEISVSDANRDVLANVASVATIAGGALDAVSRLVGMISAEVASAVGKSPSDKADIQSRIVVLQQQIAQTVAGSAYQGSNWLDGSTSSVTASGMTLDLSGLSLKGSGSTGLLNTAGTAYAGASVLSLDVTSLADADLANVRTDLTTTQSTLAGLKSRVSTMEDIFDRHSDFLGTIIGIKQRVIDDISKVDENEEEQILQALAVRREYVLRAQQMVNESARSILLLFQN